MSGEQATVSSGNKLPSFRELCKSVRNGTEMNMSLDRTFSCESTDTASEMLYDSLDQDDLLSSESFDMEENCFLDDITEEDITACISNDQVQSFEYIFWLKKLAGVIGEDYGIDEDSELGTVLSAIEYIKYLKWTLDFTNDTNSPESVCSFSSIELDYSPDQNISTDLNATFRRKLSFGDNEPPVLNSNVHSNTVLHTNHSVNGRPGPGHGDYINWFYPTTIQGGNAWRYEEDSQQTLLGYNNGHAQEKDNCCSFDDTTDMSFVEDNANETSARRNSTNVNFDCCENANTGFMDQNCTNINTNIYASLQQMCLAQDDNSRSNTISIRKGNGTLNSENVGPTEEDLIQHYFRQYPTLSSLLVDYTSDESDTPIVKRRRKKPRAKRKVKRKGSRKFAFNNAINKQIQGNKIDSTVPDTEIAEADSTTNPTSKVKKTEKRSTRRCKRSDGLKRPKNGFIRFSIEYRKVLAENHPNLDNRDVSKMLGQKWRKMTPEERKPYEEEFANDLEEMKKQNPSWKYAPEKRTGHDEIEPMPSRLRPRDKLKRKFSPYLLKTLSAKKRRLSPRVKSRKSSEVRKGAIMKCTICSKYQQIYGVPAKNVVDLRSLWYCGLNPDPKNNTCFQKPISTTRSCIPLASPATITTSGPFTSVVARSCNSSLAKPETEKHKEPPHQALKTGRPSFRPANATTSDLGDSRKRHRIVIPVSQKSGIESSMSGNNLTQSLHTSLDSHRRQLRFGNLNSALSVPNHRNLSNVNCLKTVNQSSSSLSFKANSRHHSSHQTRKTNVATTSMASAEEGNNYVGNRPTTSLASTSSASLKTSSELTNVASSSQNFFQDFKAFISFIPANIPTTAIGSFDSATTCSANTNPIMSSGTSMPSKAIDIASVSSGTIPAASAYITVIPKSVWNTLSTEAVSQLLSQRNLKQD